MEEYPGLKAFMSKQGGHYTRIAIGGGGNKSFIAWSTTSAATTWNLIPKGWAFQSMENFRIQNVRIKCAALGVDEACFLMLTDDRWWFYSGSHYTTLNEILKELHNGDIEFLALNPFRVEQFFLLRADNVAVFRVSLSFRNDLVDLLSKHGITCRDLSSQRADKPPPSLPAATKESRFLQGIVKDVAVTSFGSIIGGVASALVGAAACTVM